MGTEVRRYTVPGAGEGREDYATPVLGPSAKEMRTERRSTTSNDNDVTAPTAPPLFYTGEKDIGKFFSRGCRGKIEEVQIYCRRTGAGQLRLALTTHPCAGPIQLELITPGPTWAWVSGINQRMWNYDSLFIYVYECDADVSWGYDAGLPPDGHEATLDSANWGMLSIRPFIRIIYSSETPGDVPVSGIVNAIDMPSESSYRSMENQNIPAGIETILTTRDGMGYCDLIMFWVAANPSSQLTHFRVYCDGAVVLAEVFNSLNARGFTPQTPGVSLTNYVVNGLCALLITKRLDFRRNISTSAECVLAQTVTVKLHPTLLG